MAGGNAPKINVGKMPRKTANLFVCVYQFASCSLGFQLEERCLHSNISHQTQKGVLQVPEKMPNQRNVRMQMRLQLQLQLQVRLRNMNHKSKKSAATKGTPHTHRLSAISPFFTCLSPSHLAKTPPKPPFHSSMLFDGGENFVRATKTKEKAMKKY